MNIKSAHKVHHFYTCYIGFHMKSRKFSALEFIVACLVSRLACLMKSNPVCHADCECDVETRCTSLFWESWISNLGKLLVSLNTNSFLHGDVRLRLQFRLFKRPRFFSKSSDPLNISQPVPLVRCTVRWSLKWTPLHINATVQKLACLLFTWDSAVG